MRVARRLRPVDRQLTVEIWLNHGIPILELPSDATDIELDYARDWLTAIADTPTVRLEPSRART